MKILEGYKQNPELPGLIRHRWERKEEADENHKRLRQPSSLFPSSPARRSPASGYELVPKAVNRSEMDRACGVRLQLLAESQDVAIDSST